MRMYLIFSMLLLCFAFSNCSKKEKPLPISQEKLVSVLADVHVAEAAFNHLTGREKEKTAELYYNQIYEIQGIEKAELDTCMAMMKRNTPLMRQVYEKVMVELDKRKVAVAN